VFLGEHFHTLDEKGRLVLPAKFRSLLSGGCVVTRGRDANLVVFPSELFETQAQAVRERLEQGRVGRAEARTFFGGADAIEPDKQGRLTLRAELREYASLVKDVVVVGMGDRCEVWASDRFLSARELGTRMYLEEEG